MTVAKLQTPISRPNGIGSGRRPKPDPWPLFLQLCVAKGLPKPIREHRFHPTRKWRFDACWPARKVALECDGGIWTHGRHTRGTGWLKDAEKLNEAVCLGWKVLRCTPSQLQSPRLLDVIRRALQTPS